MDFTYLKVDPSEVVRILDNAYVKGCRVRDAIEEDYQTVSGSSDPVIMPMKLQQWGDQMSVWVNDTLEALGKIFLTSRQQYLFRDAQPNGLVRSGVNFNYEGMHTKFNARLNVLNGFIQFIFQHSNIHITAIKSNVQIATKDSSQKMTNE